MTTSALITAEELHALLDAGEKTVVLDATYGQPPVAQGIPGAVDFDIDDVADPQAPLAHTIPDADTFAEKVGAMGIDNDTNVIVYDRMGVHMAASRAWWMFRLFGHNNVRVLNGGLNAWLHAGYAAGQKNTAPTPTTFTAHYRPALVAFKKGILENITPQRFTVLDARDAMRFAGAPDPRPHVAAGHIPRSRNMPFIEMINPETGGMKPANDLRAVVDQHAIDTSKPLVTSCGSGVTACVVALGLYELGIENVAVYDGSWTEWGTDSELPIETGATA